MQWLLSTLALSVCLLTTTTITTTLASPFSRRANDANTGMTLAAANRYEPWPGSVDFYNPREKVNGSMLTYIPGPYTVGVGEPLNAIVSGRSSRSVLTPQGFLLWATSINFGVSCLGQANGTLQYTDLGDGRGQRAQGTGDGANGVLRFNYYSPYVGTCRETFEGGNHFRWWKQNGTEADSGAIFLAASRELPLAQNHMIDTNGYNLGRDEMVGNATLAGGTEWEGNRYNTTVVWVPAGLLLNATSDGVNHPDVALPGQPAQDGMVAVLTVTQLGGTTFDENFNESSVKTGVTLSITTLALFVVLTAVTCLL
ncbi:unnamed protein product [Sympodiomycopsis kandeliae]